MRKFVSLLFLPMMFSCHMQEDSVENFQYTEIEKSACVSNQENAFYFSVPTNISDGLPLIIAVDAQADGAVAAERIVEACSEMKAVVVGSATIRNGYQNYKEALTELIRECIDRFGVNERQIILTGFSGGARMVNIFAKEYPVAGLIMVGAGPGSELSDTKTYVMCGFRDFNFIEMYRRPVFPMLNEENLIFDHFYGKHEWPEPEDLRDAFYYHMKNFDLRIASVVNRRAEDLFLDADTFVMAGNGLKAWDNLDKSYKLTSDEELRKKIRASSSDLLDNEAFRLSISKLENYLRLELKLRQHYMEHTLISDLSYWKEEIKTLREKESFSSNTLEIEHSSRMLGYMGILFYSRLKMMSVTPGYEKQIETLVNAFQKLEPENPDMFYFKAMYFVSKNNMDSSGHYLALARKYGLQE